MPFVPSHTPEKRSWARASCLPFRHVAGLNKLACSLLRHSTGGGGPPGILWAPAEPCEFFAVADLAPGGEGGAHPYCGLFTLILTCEGRIVELPDRSANEDGDYEEANNVEELGEETDFDDRRERLYRVEGWIRNRNKGVGRAVGAVAETGDSPKKVAPGQAVEKEEGSDASDEEFVDEDEFDGESPSSSSDGGIEMEKVALREEGKTTVKKKLRTPTPKVETRTPKRKMKKRLLTPRAIHWCDPVPCRACPGRRMTPWWA